MRRKQAVGRKGTIMLPGVVILKTVVHQGLISALMPQIQSAIESRLYDASSYQAKPVRCV
jgi:hypothetical protein